jgi:hypothetical protein
MVGKHSLPLSVSHRQHLNIVTLPVSTPWSRQHPSCQGSSLRSNYCDRIHSVKQSLILSSGSRSADGKQSTLHRFPIQILIHRLSIDILVLLDRFGRSRSRDGAEARRREAR